METDTQELTPTVRAVRPARLGVRKLTRAHVLLSHQPQHGADAGVLLNRVCEALGKQLDSAVDASARLVASKVAPDAVSAAAAFVILELAELDARAVLEVELPLALGLIDRVAGGNGGGAPATRLTRIEEAALAFFVLRALSAGRGHALVERFGPQLSAITTEPERAAAALGGDPIVAVELTLTVTPHTGTVRLLLPARVLHTALLDPRGASPTAESLTVPDAIGAAGLIAQVRAGRCTLDRASLEALTPGDVLVLAQLRRVEGVLHGPARIVADSFELEGELSPDGVLFTRALERALPPEVVMSSPQNEVSSPAVDVEVELTRVRLPVADLAGLRPGVVLPLRTSASDPVLLRVGDRVVARAELVDIEGEVGARILAFFP